MISRFSSALFLIASLLLGVVNANAQRMQQVFKTPEVAMEQFGNAIKTKDLNAISLMLGENYNEVIPEPTQEDYQRFVAAWDRAHGLIMDGPNLAHISVGTQGWTLPIPLSKIRIGWIFDMDRADQEIDARRIGANELSTIKAMLAYGDAQREYHAADHTGDGVLQYAQKLQSTPGKKDGLYWPTNANEPRSPIGEYFAQSKSIDGLDRRGYHGYQYRILTAQGPAAKGGAKSYVQNRHMTEGFALIAWPVEYGESGVMTFIVNQDGIVYQKNLGPDTNSVVKNIYRFNPDKTWTQVSEEDLK
jgi:hypothetical protein